MTSRRPLGGSHRRQTRSPNPATSTRSFYGLWSELVARNMAHFRPQREACLRLIHEQSGSPLRFDKLGEVAWFAWYGQPEVVAGEDFLAQMRALSDLANCGQAYLRVMKNRGADAREHLPISIIKTPPLRWQAVEGNILVELRADCGLSPGIFLDQRNNRRWVYENSAGRRVLNLFSYTCLFSAAAALGGAEKVISVDTSQRYLDWGKRNFTINEVSPTHHIFQHQDVREFLKLARKTGPSFDLIICDPPSFARSKQGVFRIDEVLESLIGELTQVLSPRGQLLFCSNFAGWDTLVLQRRLRAALGSQIKSILPAPGPGADFPPGPHGLSMLSYLIQN